MNNLHEMPTDRALQILNIAVVCYEANRAYALSLGDTSFLPWDEAPKWQQDTVINGVRFHFANPDAGPAESHENWFAEKVATGWVYGPEKNPDASPPTHHCMVPFDQLPVEQQRKDMLFRAIFHALTDPTP